MPEKRQRIHLSEEDHKTFVKLVNIGTEKARKITVDECFDLQKKERTIIDHRGRLVVRFHSRMLDPALNRVRSKRI